MREALLSKAAGGVDTIHPANGDFFTLSELQRYVDGLIEIVQVNEKFIMVINDEGKFTKEPNLAATFAALMSNAIAPNDYLCGDVVVCESDMVK